MENARPLGFGDLGFLLAHTNCTCSFCLLVFTLRDPTEGDLSALQSHLEKSHGLKLGEPEL
jgi:hypothetical protein